MSIFISYRRVGGGEAASAIYQALSPDYRVFMDTLSLRNGQYTPQIEKHLKECSDFILIVNPTLFDRCSEPGDWVYHEIATALKDGKNIIPVFVQADQFPDNIPSELACVTQYTAITWSSSPTIHQTLCDFLVSNERRVLTFIREGNDVRLDTQSRDSLRALFERTFVNGYQPVDIDIRLADPEDFSNLVIDRDILRTYGMNTAVKDARQTVMHNLEIKKTILETAIAFMLQDEMVASAATTVRHQLCERNGITSCAQWDAAHNIRDYGPYYLWIEMIHELAKELVFDRLYVSINQHGKYFPIDVWRETQAGEEIWGFLTFVRVDPEAPDYQRFRETITLLRCYADIMDIPKTDLAFRVYPDLYYHMARLKLGREKYRKYTYDQVCAFRNAPFCLNHYHIGPH